jgi:transketolase
MSKKKLLPNPVEVRLRIIDLLYKSEASHLGSSMSVVEILIAMYSLCNIQKIREKKIDRSRIIVSKGHCASATYVVSNFFNLLSNKFLESYHADNSLLAGHVSHSVPYVEHSTGALGHGLSVAVGCAIGLKSKSFNKSLSLCLCGDGEIQEGSIWEALMIAGHKKLDNLVVFIDYNKISSIKETNKVVNLEPLQEKFKSFNFEVAIVDGHSLNEITSAVKKSIFKGKPTVLICNTIKGKDIPFAENQPVWHYRTLNESLYKEARQHLLKIL